MQEPSSRKPGFMVFGLYLVVLIVATVFRDRRTVKTEAPSLFNPEQMWMI